MKLIFSTAIITLLLLSPGISSAQFNREEAKERHEDRLEQVTERKEQMAEIRADRIENRDERREEMTTRIEERKATFKERLEEHKERREEIRTKLDERRKENVAKHLENIFARFDGAIEHLTDIADRIEARITKIEDEKGVDLSDAKEALNEAFDAIATAQADADAAQELAQNIIEGETSKEEIRVLVTTAKGSIVIVHQSLKETVRLVKASASDSDDDTN